MTKQNMLRTDMQILRDLLTRAKRDAEAFCDSDAESIDLSWEVREPSASYIDTWVAGPVSLALDLLNRSIDRLEGSPGDESA